MPSEQIPADLEVSVVIPVYNERENLPDLVNRVDAALREAAVSWELICVDDGSSDGSGPLLARLARANPQLHPIWLKRNYGQSTAMQAGFDAARGRVIITLDGDLQNDPADIPRLLKMLDANPEVDIISGWRKKRQDAFILRKFPSMLANRLISKVTGVRLRDYGCSLKLYRREALQNVKLYGELHRFVPALAKEFGARVMETEVMHHPRLRGVSKYSIDRTIRVLLDLMWVKFLLRFLHRPMHAFGGVGLALFIPGMLALAYLSGLKLFTGADIGGRPLLLLGVMFSLMGAQFLGMGILGEILIRIWHEPTRSQYLLKEAPEDPAGARPE